MPISEFVEEIIKARNAKKPVIETKRRELNDLLKALDAFDNLKSQILDENGEVIQGRYAHLVSANPEMQIKLGMLNTVACRKKIDAAMKECDSVYNRFSRERINISVIGMAGVGKSALLQSITNLDGKVIPSADGNDCTGAISVIENHPDMAPNTVKAVITFKTEQQMIDIVQEFLDVMIVDEAQKIKIHNMYQIRDLSMTDIESRMPQHSPHNSKKQHLRKYIEKYQDWAPLVATGTTLTLTDKAEIQEYVAQHNGEEVGTSQYREFNKYLAVDSCHILCRFNYEDAGKITLLDTVGLGDTTIGIEKNMLKVVKEESDAVIFLHKSLTQRSKGIPQAICDVYELIEKNCRNRNLEQWLSWMINRDNRPLLGNTNAMVQDAMARLKEIDYAGKLREIVDVSNQQQVQDQFLIPLLQQLQENLKEIDDLYTTDLKSALTAVREEYNRFCTSAKKVMDSQLTAGGNQTQIDKDIQIMQQRLIAQVNALALDEKDKRNLPCPILKDRVNGILKDLKDGKLIPSVDVLKQEHAYLQAHSLYIKHCNVLRNEISQRFAQVDGSLNELVIAVKNSIANILYSDEGCKLGKVLAADPEKELYEWMADFAEMFLNNSNYPTLYKAFKNVGSFNFSVNGFLTYEVRACLDLLDPDLTNIPEVLGSTKQKTVENINFWLYSNVLDVVDEMNDNLKVLFQKPHRAFFALIKEFGDNVIYAENVEIEWRNLFRDNYAIIEADKYKNMAVAVTVFGEWADMLKKLLDLNSKANLLAVI